MQKGRNVGNIGGFPGHPQGDALVLIDDFATALVCRFIPIYKRELLWYDFYNNKYIWHT